MELQEYSKPKDKEAQALKSRLIAKMVVYDLIGGAKTTVYNFRPGFQA